MLGERYTQLAPEFAGALFGERVERGTVWITPDAGAVAMWDGPGRARRDAVSARLIWRRFNTLADTATKDRLAAYNEAIKRASPQQPFWYLGVLATHPALQRQGLASAVLNPALDDASAAGIACCLETSTEANRRFYEHRGFQTEHDITVSGGPQTWWMHRPARL